MRKSGTATLISTRNPSTTYKLTVVLARLRALPGSHAGAMAVVPGRGLPGAVGNDTWKRRTGVRPLALGRHSLMNGIGVRGGAAPEIQRNQLARLVEFARGDQQLRNWRETEYRRMATEFDPDAEVPLRDWRARWPSGRAVSEDAFARLSGSPCRRPSTGNDQCANRGRAVRMIG